jgi:hypothetical protein
MVGRRHVSDGYDDVEFTSGGEIPATTTDWRGGSCAHLREECGRRGSCLGRTPEQRLLGDARLSSERVPKPVCGSSLIRRVGPPAVAPPDTVRVLEALQTPAPTLLGWEPRSLARPSLAAQGLNAWRSVRMAPHPPSPGCSPHSLSRPSETPTHPVEAWRGTKPRGLGTPTQEGPPGRVGLRTFTTRRAPENGRGGVRVYLPELIAVVMPR